LLEINKIYNMDCLEGMKYIENKSIDMILCDLPYGVTQCNYDNLIPFEPLWNQYERIIKNNGAIVLFGTQPFTTDLINSNRKLFRYELIWCKNFATGSLLAKKRPMKAHENLLVFYKKQPTYNPQMVERTDAELKRLSKKSVKTKSSEFQPYGGMSGNREDNKYKMPNSQLHFNCVFNRSKEKTKHPNQKPVSILEWLIKTYTNEGELVLDNCGGSGSTYIACINTNRNFIGFELNKEYYELAKNRINKHILDNNLQDRYSLIA